MSNLTTKDILMHLPEDVRELAIANTSKDILALEIIYPDTIGLCLRGSFLWDETPEGYDFWEKVFNETKKLKPERKEHQNE